MKYCAFFDLDETIISTKSMVGIMEAYYMQNSLIGFIGMLKFKTFMKKMN